MEKRLFLLLFIYLVHSGLLHAQWSEKDSLWILDIVSGKEKIHLNQETLKAIRSGTLIGTDKSVLDPISAPSQLPISRYFEGILPIDSSTPSIDFSKLPPSVFVQYGPKAKLEDELESFKIYPEERENLKGLSRGGSFSFDAEDILRTVFWKSHRAKKRNRKNANAWKTYNNY